MIVSSKVTFATPKGVDGCLSSCISEDWKRLSLFLFLSISLFDACFFLRYLFSEFEVLGLLSSASSSSSSKLPSLFWFLWVFLLICYSVVAQFVSFCGFFCSDNLWDFASVSLLICEGFVSSLPRFLSKIFLTSSETSTKVALPWVKLVSEAFSSLSDDWDSILIERLFLLFPMMKTILGVNIIELQRYLGEMKPWKLSLQTKKNCRVWGLWLVCEIEWLRCVCDFCWMIVIKMIF